MKLHSDMKFVYRMAAILLLVGAADVLAVMILPHPLPWAGIIPGMIPVLTAFFVIRPFLKGVGQA